MTTWRWRCPKCGATVGTISFCAPTCSHGKPVSTFNEAASMEQIEKKK